MLVMDNNASVVSSAPNKPKKLLIVEDDFFIRDLYGIEARGAGYETVIAADGEEALERAKSSNPDLILMDVMLPKMDGISALKALKADVQCANIPVVLITNLEDSSKEQEARQAGAKDYLLKIKNTPNMVVAGLGKYFAA